MSDEQLKQICFSKGVRFPKSTFSSAYSVNREADRSDIIFRLKEAVFGLRPGEFGPLPVAPEEAARPSGPPHSQAAPKPPEAGKAADDGWKSHARHARIQRLLEEFPSFNGPALGPEADRWNDAELRQYFFSNGYIRPRLAADTGSTRQVLPHYNTLGISHAATPEEVRRAYRALALKHHPDKQSDDGSSEYFQRIQAAYAALAKAGLA